MDMLKSFIELNKKALRKIKKKHKKNQPNDKDVNKVTEFKLLSFSSAFEEERVKMVTNSPPCSSGFVNSRTLTGCTDPLCIHGGRRTPSASSRFGSQLPLPLYADVRLHITMTHRNDRCGGLKRLLQTS